MLKVFLGSFLVFQLALLIFAPIGKAQNNPFGVHILDPSEIESAAKIINSNGGDWGYVTVPIRANDRDLKKWQKFMNTAQNLHVIPILRLAGIPEGEYWNKPNFDQIIDFSNFLNDLVWPTTSKHVVIYNEPNHSREWGGQIDPGGYGETLEFAIDRFKSLDQNFLVLPAAMDAAVPNSSTSMSQYRYLERMFARAPGLANKIEAINSHSYPNPAFSGKPTDKHKSSIISFKHEQTFFRNFTGKNLPIYITETGWQMLTIEPNTVANYYQQAFEKVWSDKNIVAVTPFLLHAAEGEFQKFSLLAKDGSLTSPGRRLTELTKTQGKPQLTQESNFKFANFPTSDQSQDSTSIKKTNFLSQKFNQFIESIKKLFARNPKNSALVGNTRITLDVADNDKERQQGLSGRESMPANTGMLFVFDSPNYYSFWMKEMKFPLDFIWILDNQVVDVDTNVPNPKAGESPTVVGSNVKFNKVIEVNAGFIQKNNIHVGDTVRINL